MLPNEECAIYDRHCTAVGGTKGHAVFSDCGRYRYMLSRKFEGGLWYGDGHVNFIMLNPSTATQDEDDPTIRRCIGYAQEWGFAGLTITNLFALRATDPQVMKAAANPVGPENNAHLRHWACQAKLCCCAWGRHGEHLGRAGQVLQLLSNTKLKALKLLDAKTPGHPLYLKADLKPVEFIA